jgi:hypothetical protein
MKTLRAKKRGRDASPLRFNVSYSNLIACSINRRQTVRIGQIRLVYYNHLPQPV